MSDVSLQAEVVWQSNYESVLRETDDLEQRIERLSAPINLDLAVDTSRLAELDTLISDQSLDVTIDPVVESDSDLDNLLRLESESIAPEIDPTLDDAPINEVKDLDDEVVTPEVDVQEKNAQDSVLKKLDDLRALGVISVTLDVLGNVSPMVGTVLDLISTDAAALLNARTGGSIENAGELIDNVFTTSLATSRDEAAQLLAVAQQLGVPFEELQSAVGGAFDTAIVQGQDVNEVLATADLLVKSGLAENFTNAYDIITAGFQSGANQGDEFLSILREYGSTFSEMGFSAEETLSAIDSGLAAGIDNADRIADAIRETRIRAMEVDNEDVNTAYSSLGLGDELAAFRQGELTGAQLWEGITSALADKSTGEQSALLASIVGTQAEDFGAEALLSVDTTNEAFDNLEGRMEQASETFQDTLGQTLTTFFEMVQVEAGEFLSSDQLGLADKVNAIKDGLGEALDVLQEGGTLGEALEQGFEIKGVDEFIHQFQSAMGNFVIAILQVVATLQELIPGGSDGAATRAQIASMAQTQLAFDLEGSTADNIVSTLTTAIQRGVDEAAVGQALTDQINAMVQNGDVGGARELLAQFGEGNAANIDVTGLSAQVDGLAQGMLTEFYAALESGDVDVAAALAQSLGDPEALQSAFAAAFAAGDFSLATTLAEQLNDPAAVQTVQTALQTLRDNATAAIAEGDASLFIDATELLPEDEVRAIAQTHADTLRTMAEEALTNNDWNLASDIAEALDDDALRQRLEDLWTVTDEGISVAAAAAGKTAIDTTMHDLEVAAQSTNTQVSAAMTSAATATEDADGRIGTAGDSMVNAQQEVGGAGEEMGAGVSTGADTAADSIQALETQLSSSAARIIAQLAAIKSASADMDTLANAAATTTLDAEQNYTGGVASGWSWVGERGPELMHFDQSAAILNNQSSMRMMDLLGGGMGGGTINQYNTWNVNSGATADAAVTRILNQLRGLTG